MRDFGSIVKDKGIPWVRHWIDATFEFSKNFVKPGTTEIDFEALGREEWEFRKALKTKDFSKNERAKYLWDEALSIHNRHQENGKKGGRPKKSPQDAPNGNAGVDMSDAGNGDASKSPTSCGTLTADGDIREDSQAEPDGSAITRNETRAHDALEPSANIYGDAATREGAEVVYTRESGIAAPTTVSENMWRVPQNEAPAHGFSGGRTAQGTMSRSPEAAAQSGKDYDQEPSISTDERCTGADSLRSDCHSAPVRLPDFDEFTRFIDQQGLDYTDAREWWEMTMVDRGGKDRDGKPIRNWKITCRRFCEAKANKRKTAK
ncbi:MAG: hypothetical protein J6P30_01830 [Fibrobacter sp.]|nr:hypothetical protein [Fibrobacter sp.]